MRVRLTISLLLLCLLGLTSAVGAEERVLADTEEFFPEQSLFVIDLGGSFRTRAELWQDVHLGLSPVPNKYGVYPQLSGPSGVRESSDFRLRITPAMHVGEMADVFAVVDLFSVMAGEGGYSDLARTLLRADQATVPGDAASPLETAAVRALWGEVHLFHLLTFQAGRIPDHWGMGLVENDGRGLDEDGGDFIDGVALKAELPWWGLKVLISWDFPLQGRSAESAFGPWGVGYDPGDLDDIQQWRFKISMEPGPDAAGNYWAWGVYNRLRYQDFTSLGAQSPYEECRLYPWAPGFGCNEMFWRDALVWTPDVWFAGGVALAPDVLWRVELEVAGRYGTLSNTRFVPEKSGRTLYGIGGALRTDIKTPRVTAGVEVGASSGDTDSLAFGILDEPVIGEPDSAGGVQGSDTQNETITSFALHPSYRVDQILFRRVIGAVTNALYVKPSVRFEYWQRGDSALWIDAAALYASAFVASSTPGEENALGVEADVGLGGRFGRNVEMRLDGALLVPLGGLTNASTLENPLPWTTRLLLNFSF